MVCEFVTDHGLAKKVSDSKTRQFNNRFLKVLSLWPGSGGFYNQVLS
jgi:hypothetical protein